MRPPCRGSCLEPGAGWLVISPGRVDSSGAHEPGHVIVVSRQGSILSFRPQPGSSTPALNRGGQVMRSTHPSEFLIDGTALRTPSGDPLDAGIRAFLSIQRQSVGRAANIVLRTDVETLHSGNAVVLELAGDAFDPRQITFLCRHATRLMPHHGLTPRRFVYRKKHGSKLQQLCPVTIDHCTTAAARILNASATRRLTGDIGPWSPPEALGHRVLARRLARRVDPHQVLPLLIAAITGEEAPP
jgi:hypothetical protein